MNKSGNTEGYTLIEMIIGLGLSVVLLSALFAFLRNQSANQSKKASRAAAMKANKTLIESVKRDFRFQTVYAVAADGKSLDLTRKKLYQKNAAEGVYKVLYKTECVKVTAPNTGTQAILEKAYSGANKANFAQAKGQCISSLNCPAGELPQVKLVPGATGADVPIYAQTEFPRLTTDLKEQSWGSGLCFFKVQTKIRVIAESAWIVDHTGAALSVVSDELILSPSEFSNVEMIPAH